MAGRLHFERNRYIRRQAQKDFSRESRTKTQRPHVSLAIGRETIKGHPPNRRNNGQGDERLKHLELRSKLCILLVLGDPLLFLVPDLGRDTVHYRVQRGVHFVTDIRQQHARRQDLV